MTPAAFDFAGALRVVTDCAISKRFLAQATGALRLAFETCARGTQTSYQWKIPSGMLAAFLASIGVNSEFAVAHFENWALSCLEIHLLDVRIQ